MCLSLEKLISRLFLCDRHYEVSNEPVIDPTMYQPRFHIPYF